MSCYCNRVPSGKRCVFCWARAGYPGANDKYGNRKVGRLETAEDAQRAIAAVLARIPPIPEDTRFCIDCDKRLDYDGLRCPSCAAADNREARKRRHPVYPRREWE